MFAPKAVALTTGCTYRQVDYWIRRGYVHPDQTGEGSGTGRWLLGPSYIHARKVAWLVMAGVAPDTADLLARGIDLPVGNGEVLRIVRQ